MNKKGFTLVEIIAVIVLFSVILSIVVPSVSSVMKKSKINSFKIATEELVDAVDLAITADNLSVETLNNFSVTQMFSELGINVSNAEKFKSITFSCASTSDNVCTDYTVYAVGKGKYENHTAFGHNNNITSKELTSEIGITINYINSLNNYMKSSSFSDGIYDISSITAVSFPSEIISGTVLISNGRVVDYSINLDGKTVVYDQEKRLPVIE